MLLQVGKDVCERAAKEEPTNKLDNEIFGVMQNYSMKCSLADDLQTESGPETANGCAVQSEAAPLT